MKHPTIRHLALIPDGNRRWARDQGLTTYEGHQKGFEVISDLGRHVREIGIPIFTVWAFSTENWKRDPGEVKYLMQIFEQWFQSNLETAKEEKIRIIHIGRRDRIPHSLLKTIIACETETASFDSHTLVIALDYGGQDEIVRAMKEAQKNEL
jgi:undecaprenyl diphosphate synthase